MKFFKPDLKWSFQRSLELIKKYLITPYYTLPHKQPFSHTGISITRNLSIPMRDEVRLFGDLYKPAGKGPFPVVLIRMPYGKQEAYCYMPAHGKYWAGHGYACFIQDVRGKWASEGEWEPFINEANDGWDTLNWIASQPWCNGNIGMTGESYYGYTQWAVAPLNHPNLKCIVPGNTAADIYGSWMYVNHAFCPQTMGSWLIDMQSHHYNNPLRINHSHLPIIEVGKAANLPDRDYRAVLENPNREDAYWKNINIDHKFDQIKIPILHWGGWYDVFLQGTLDAWEGMKARQNNQWLLISATDHETTPMFTGRIGNLEIGKESWSYDFILEFFDHFLKGIENRYSNKPPVEIFVMGDNQWRTENEWPLERILYTRYYLHSNGDANSLYGSGKLDIHPPHDEIADQYDYDPNHPVDFATRVDLWHLAESMEDRTSLETRQDILVYTSDAIQLEAEITGPIKASLYASSSTVDTDFTVTLVDVFPDGYAQLIQEGIIRARYREDVPSLIEPGKIYEYDIDLWATSYVFTKGHRIRVEVSSSNFSRYNRSLNGSQDYSHSKTITIAHQSIYHDAAHPSCIILPIIPR